MAADSNSIEQEDVRGDPGSPVADSVAVTLPKAGHDEDENEDAFVVRDETFPVRAAVADGATEAVYSGVWADLLTRQIAALDDWSGTGWDDAVHAARSEWQTVVDAEPVDVPWYVAEKREQGAFATVLGLVIRGDGTFEARWVGDCVLIQQSKGSKQSWPVDDPEAFTHRPALLSSRSEAGTITAQTTEGTWDQEDVFLLATDAVAAWLLRETPELAHDADALREQLRTARQEGHLRNDDCTIIRITMAAG
ncbi:protein phosphatase 2C domain-containing protein [Longibacter salinarum]|nr:protein phosphatase 2C domain-containing protein [Longibacter salinarum]